MFTEHKNKIIAGIAAAFLAAFAVFYDSVVTFVTYTFITPEVVETVVDPQITDAVTTETPVEAAEE
jgi:dolichol kinase